MDDKLKKPNIFGGFQALTSSLLPDIPGDKPLDDDDIPVLDDIKNILDNDEPVDDNEPEPVDKPKKVVKKKLDDEPVDNDEPADDDEPIDINDIIKDNKKVSKAGDEPSDLTEFEPDITNFFQDKLSEELGWEFEEGEKFKSVKELVDFMKTVVDESSKPVYANEEIEKLNKFVTDGGKLEDYYKKAQPGGIDVGLLDATKDSDAKIAVREKLRLQGYNDEKIKKALSRYEDNGVLIEEGEDAVEFLKEYKTTSQKKLLEDTENSAVESRKQQQKFYSAVETNIKGLDTIRGIKISDRDKKDLLDYIFKPDSEGLTKYQREYMSDVKNLIESAYFTKQGDQLISSAKKAATSDAYKDLHQKLKANKGKRHSGGITQGGSDSSDSLTNLLGKTLLKQ